jgi:Magnesium chelatase, subunit ChlI
VLVDPPGCGKTMFARRVPSILPAMTIDEALEVTRVYSVAGLLGPRPRVVATRPFRRSGARRPGHHAEVDEHLIPPRDLDALAAYVDSLHRPDDRGGYSLASAGPVGEGLVAWLIGIGTTVLVTFAVGETLKSKAPG